jgi:hypothetical protein
MVVVQLFEFGQDVLEVKYELLALLNLLLLYAFELMHPETVVNSLE